jgi:8-oxo-dGTP pyrophosphatase MutT (NUDIX family)
MIRFDVDDQRFNYRVVGVAIHNASVLLHRAGSDSFWTLPGGRAELGETAEQTIRREMHEELAAEVEVVRPLWFVENFFDYNGRSYHEIALYFLIGFPAGSVPWTTTAFERPTGDAHLTFQWFPLSEESLAQLPLLPAFLRKGLVNLPTALTHVVERSGSMTR